MPNSNIKAVNTVIATSCGRVSYVDGVFVRAGEAGSAEESGHEGTLGPTH